MKRILPRESVRKKLETISDYRLLLEKYCTGFDLLLLENGWVDLTARWTSDLSWKGASQKGKFRPLYVLNFVLPGANENGSTGLAPRMTSSQVTNHMTW